MLTDVTSKGRYKLAAAKVWVPGTRLTSPSKDGQATMRIGKRSTRSPSVPDNAVGMDVPSIWMGGPCPQGKVTGALVFNGAATAALRAGMAIRERPTGNGDSTSVRGDNW
jgi:hypothetical protein